MAPKSGILELAVHYLRLHAWLYGSALLLASVLALKSAGWWFFWPLMTWTLLFLFHFLVVKSLRVSSDWVDQRTERTANRASDISHIESIRERYERSFARSQEHGSSDGSETGAEDRTADSKGSRRSSAEDAD